METEGLYDWSSSLYEKYVVNQRFLNPAVELATTVQKLKKGNESSCLDIGTGTGVVINEIQKILGKNIHVYGLDSSSEMLKIARKKGIKHLIQSYLPDLPFLEDTFDFVTASFVISHILDYDRLVSEINRVLSKGGYFVFTTWGKGQAEYNQLWNNVVKEYISKNQSNQLVENYIPNEEFFESKDNIMSLFDSSGFKSIDNYEKKYELNLSLEEYLECRYGLLTGAFLKKVLSERLWKNFQEDVFLNFHQVTGKEIIYVGRVNFFIFQKR